MTVTLRLFALNAALMLVPALSQAADAGKVAAAAVPAGVNTVVSGGDWSEGKTEGFCRAVVTEAGVENVNQSLFAQWIAVDVHLGTYRLVASVPVRQINTGHADAYHITIKAAPSDNGRGFDLDVAVTGIHSGETQNYVLVLSGHPGTYKLKEASAPGCNRALGCRR